MIVSRFGAESTTSDVIEGIDLSNRQAIVTGGASGIGMETARALAAAGARVTIAARKLEDGAKAAAAINADFPNKRVQVRQLDLASLASVRQFAAHWENQPLDILVNNAGVMACPLSYTEDGFETQFGVNHLGHFLLTLLLTPALQRGAPSRVVSLSSVAHIDNDINLEDPYFRSRDYDPFVSYGQSKTANILFAAEYDRRHRDKGIRAFSVMPGVIDTQLMRHLSLEIKTKLGLAPGPRGAPAARQRKYKTVEQGAATSVWAAVAPELQGLGGLYLEDCAETKLLVPGERRAGKVAPFAMDADAAQRLWAFSESEVNLHASA